MSILLSVLNPNGVFDSLCLNTVVNGEKGLRYQISRSLEAKVSSSQLTNSATNKNIKYHSVQSITVAFRIECGTVAQRRSHCTMPASIRLDGTKNRGHFTKPGKGKNLRKNFPLEVIGVSSCDAEWAKLTENIELNLFR